MRHELVDQGIQPIIRGIASGREDDAVVVLTHFRDGLRRNLCSATVVAPRLVVTARHCVSDAESSTACTDGGTAVTGAAIRADRAPGDLVVFVGKSGTVPDTEIEANGTARGAKLVVSASSTLCNADIAFLVLDREVDAPIAPVRLAPPSTTEKLSIVGWGVDETGQLPKRRGVRTDVPILGVGPDVYPENPRYGYGSAEFMLGESACAGDSGGPALSSRGSIIGVASRAGNGLARDPYNYASTCVGSSAHAVYSYLGAHEELVMRAFQEAGEPLWVEGEASPRLPASTNAASPPPPAPPTSTTKSAREETPVDPSPPSPSPAEAAHCGMSSEPQNGAVEHAAGLVALLATLVGLRRRFGRRDIDASHGPRQRLPSIP